MLGLLYLTGFCERFVLLVDQGSEEMFGSSYDIIDATHQMEGWLLLVTCLSMC